MKNLFVRLLLFFLFFDASKGLCDNVVPDVRMQPISPQAWNFVTYGGHDLNLHTGTIGVTIPIYTYEDRDFKLPISLTYSSSGFMPHKQSDIVGYDWFLHVGGIITRERRGMRDEFAENIPLPQYGYMYYSNRNSSDLKYCLRKKDLYGDTRALLWKYDDNGNRYEMAPDIFHFNFMGYRGSFQFGPDNMIYIYNTNCPQGELKITKFNLTSATIPHLLIEITDGYGYKYTFGGNIHAVDYASSEYDYLVGSEEQEKIDLNMNLEPISWHLTKIEAPNGRKVVFHYSTYERNLISHIRPKFEITTTKPIGLFVSSDNEDPYFTTSAQLDNIIIDDWKVDFNYVVRGNNNDYYNERASQIANVFSSKLLSHIYISCHSNGEVHTLKTCDLKYCRPPKMLLEEVSLSGEGKYMMKYYGDAKTPVINTFAVDHWGYWNGVATASTFIPIAGFVNQYSPFESNPDIILSNTRDVNEETTKWGMLTSITYPTKGRTDFDYELNNYSSVVKHCPFINTSVYDYELMQIDSIGTAGGLRIKSIKDYDINNKLLSSREYKYNYLFDDNYDENYLCRTGILLKSPRYLVTIPYKNIESDINDGRNFIKSDWDLYSLDRSIVEYRFVAEVYNDGSTIEYRFSTWDDYPDIVEYTTKECTYSNDKTDIVYIPDYNECDNFRFGPSGITYNTYVDPDFSNGVYNLLKKPNSLHPERGKLLSKWKYDKSHHIIDGEQRFYSYKNKQTFSVCPMYVSLDYCYYHKDYVDDCTLDSVVYYKGSAIFKKVGYRYNAAKQLSRQIEYNSNGSKITTFYDYVKDKKYYNTVEEKMIERNIIKYPLQEYKILRFDHIPDNYVVDYNRVKYSVVNNLVLPKEVYKAYLDELWSRDVEELSTYKDLTLSAYDQYGNVTEVKDKLNRYTCYIWSSNGLYLLAKIVNASLSTVNTLLANAPESQDTVKLSSDKETMLRNNLPNAMITTYEYKPYVGIASITDPNGCKITYEYNSTGKLCAEYDHEGNIIRKYDYSTDK